MNANYDFIEDKNTTIALWKEAWVFFNWNSMQKN